MAIAVAIVVICLAAFVLPAVANADETRPRILVTNDDGYSAEGIRVLAEALSRFADVVVVAPAINLSGASQSTLIFRPPPGFTIRDIDMGENIDGYSITGTPADSVYAGIVLFGGERGFDLLVSGINEGVNYGDAYYYSGTIGAAFQAASQGLPAIAVSQASRRPEYAAAAEFASKLAKALLREPLADGIIVSVNVPEGDINGAIATPPGTGPFHLELVLQESAGGIAEYLPKLVIGTNAPTHDIKAFREGYISVTPLRLDRSDLDSLQHLANLDFIGLPSD